MNLPGTRIVQQYSWLRHLKYLLLVPIFIANGEAQRHSHSTRPTPSFAGGATYVRWGRTKCPTGTELVYSGVAGGSFFAHSGGGSNYLCLPSDPLWGVYNKAVGKGSKIYGAEYQDPSTLELDNVQGRRLHDYNVPCAVCRSLTKVSIIMIPARNKCYDGWIPEYDGFLMSGHNGHSGRYEFVCMDKSPEADPAGFQNEDGALFYQVEGVCGSLPCPPYFSNVEFTCVVCGK